jgi:molybdopterin synthase catalytic subunit
MADHIAVQEADFDAGAEIAVLGNEGVGAVASFVGLVRADRKVGYGDMKSPEGVTAVQAMTLEHYPGMTEKALEDIVAQANSRWQLLGVRIIHRVGRLLPGERIVFVGVASSHRHDAFAACEFIMDFLKTLAPFWKREETAAGARWVDARESDSAALNRWQGS